MAEYLSLGPVDSNTAMWMRDAVQSKKLPDVGQLRNPKYFPYRYGQALWAYIAGRFGDGAIPKLLREAARSGDVEKAIGKVLQEPAKKLVEDWHAALKAAYEPLVAQTRPATDYGRVLISKQHGGGNLNVSPVLSPDGESLVFFSEKSQFSIDLLLADAKSGRVRQRVLRSDLDPHFDNLEFIDSAGAFDAAGRRLAFGAVAKGRPELVVIDVATNKTLREISLPALGEVVNPTWSPDGTRIAFSALAGGFTDLYVYDFAAGALHRLTEDAWAELQPAWSPDGGRIAFVTDRFSGDLEELRPGDATLALLDVDSGRISPVAGLPRATNFNPQWSPDGASLYFLSDANGVDNLYRLELASGRLLQLTDLFTGISGITGESPALSVASRSGQIAFSLYQDGKYSIYTADPAALASRAARAGPAPERQAAVLPPQERGAERLPAMLADARTGLPESSQASTTPYHPHLTLDYIGQPYVVAGADRFGTYLGGGTSLFFSDMLGQHNLATALQVNGTFKDIGGQVAYVNLAHRWNWGLIAEQVPYLTGAFSSSLGSLDGEPVLIQQELRFRQTDRSFSGVVYYPFSRVARVEAQAGLRRISFDQELETAAFDLATGGLVLDRTEQQPAPDALKLAQTSGAFVYDSSVFGPTSPIVGQRYRLEISPTFGSIRFSTALADYRRYFMPARPFTLGARILHYGRYGAGAEDERLVPLYLGYASLVRGYDINSFSASECSFDPSGGCPEFDRLIGSRLLVANAELRFPLLGVLLGRGSWYGPLPLEMALFADGGVAWNQGEKPSFLGGDRKPVASAGVAMRANVLGFAVVELDFVHPFDRGRSWVWQFNFTPGF